jgi:hypothetical protein
MPKGLTRNSSPIQVSSKIQETAANTFTSVEIDLTLNALDQEVFVVTQLNIDLADPDADLIGVGATGVGSSSVTGTLSSTARTTIGSIADSNVIGQARKSWEIGLLTGAGGEPALANAVFDREDPLFAPTTEEYIGIIATSNMHLNILGNGNLTAKGASVRVYGYRAKMDAAGYAALVQSQVLSA